jgi:hypothetical protein
MRDLQLKGPVECGRGRAAQNVNILFWPPSAGGTLAFAIYNSQMVGISCLLLDIAECWGLPFIAPA